MQGVKKLRVVVAVCISLSGVAGAAVVEKPTVLPDAMISITVSDLHGFIDGLGNVASSVSPMANGMMIKNMLGMQLGDPGLTGIAPGKGLAVVATDSTNVFVVVEVGAAQLGAYTNALAAKGVAFKSVDGALVVGQTSAAVEKGIGLVSEVEGTLLAKRTPVMRIDLQPASLVAKNQDKIDQMLLMMPMIMGMQQAPGMDAKATQNVSRMLEGELRVLLSLAKQCETAEIVLAPRDTGLDINETYVPLLGTRLSTLLAAPKAGVSNPKIQSGLFGNTAIAYDGVMGNPDATSAFLVAETEQLFKDMDLKDVAVSNIVVSMSKWMNIYGGAFCESVNFGDKGELAVNCALEIKDETATLGLFKTIKDDMAPFLKLYENMGIPMQVEFKENAREYKGIKIHQFKTAMNVASMPEEQKAQLAAMHLTNLVYDVAITDGVLLYAMGDTKIETIIDRLKDGSFKPVPLKARSVYPPDGFYYCDIDVAKYGTFLASIMPKDPQNPMSQIVPMLQGSEPITSAGFREDGRVMFGLHIPATLIAKLGQISMMMQMQQMQQQMQAVPQSNMPVVVPQAMPEDMPEQTEPAPQP